MFEIRHPWKHSEIMEKNLKAADIIFVMHTKSRISRMLAWFMQSRFSHVGIIAEVTSKQVYLRETTDFEVGISLLDHYLNDPEVSFEIWSCPELNDAARDTLVDRTHLLDGDVYGYFQLLTLGVRCLFKRLGIRPFKNFLKIGTVCCEVVCFGYQLSGIAQMELDNYEAEDTQDLYERVTGSGVFLKVMEKKAVSI